MLARNKHHIWKEHGPKAWDMDIPRDSLISSSEMIMMKMQQNSGLFGPKRV